MKRYLLLPMLFMMQITIPGKIYDQNMLSMHMAEYNQKLKRLSFQTRLTKKNEWRIKDLETCQELIHQIDSLKIAVKQDIQDCDNEALKKELKTKEILFDFYKEIVQIRKAFIVKDSEL